jgi:hypothetical protein
VVFEDKLNPRFSNGKMLPFFLYPEWGFNVEQAQEGYGICYVAMSIGEHRKYPSHQASKML